MKGITIFKVENLINYNCTKCINNKNVAARPFGLGGFMFRLKCAYKVFTGKADIVVWEEEQ